MSGRVNFPTRTVVLDGQMPVISYIEQHFRNDTQKFKLTENPRKPRRPGH